LVLIKVILTNIVIKEGKQAGQQGTHVQQLKLQM